MAHQMDNTNHNQHNGSGGSGFIIGVIVGVILTLLLTTKRGRIILKELLEKGIEKFSNLEDFMQEATERANIEIDDEFEDEDDFVPTAPIKEIETPKVKKVEITVEAPTKAPLVKETPAPKQKKEEPIRVEVKQEELVEDEPVKAPEKPKAVQAKRWFRRGLRKKS
jgi:hypothetical protein